MGLGPGEIVIILLIAYVIVGPEDMGKLARTLARALRELRKLTSGVREELDLSSITKAGDGLRDDTAAASVRESADAVRTSVGTDLDNVLQEIRKAEELIEKK